jgi:hypothetical protein
MAFWQGLAKAFTPKAPTRALAAGEASKMRALRTQVRGGTPYAALEPGAVRKDFNVSGFLKGTKTPPK